MKHMLFPIDILVLLVFFSHSYSVTIRFSSQRVLEVLGLQEYRLPAQHHHQPAVFLMPGLDEVEPIPRPNLDEALVRPEGSHMRLDVEGIQQEREEGEEALEEGLGEAEEPPQIRKSNNQAHLFIIQV